MNLYNKSSISVNIIPNQMSSNCILLVCFFLCNIFFVCFVPSTINDPGIFQSSSSKWFALHTFSVFITCGQATTFINYPGSTVHRQTGKLLFYNGITEQKN